MLHLFLFFNFSLEPILGETWPNQKILMIGGPSSSAEETLGLPSANIVNWVVLSTNSIK